jgi:5-methylthioadenosine/S-adenosylhomocysteine deaminase
VFDSCYERCRVAIVVAAGLAVASGPVDEMRAQFPDAEVTGGSDLIMVPGMVNSHDHGRGLGPAALGIPDDMLEVWVLALSNRPRLDPYLLAVYDGLRLVRSGVSLVLHSHSLRTPDRAEWEIEETLRGYRDAGIRVAFDLPVVDQNPLTYDEPAFLRGLTESERQSMPEPSPALDRAAYFDLCTGLVRNHHDPAHQMVTVCVGPSGPQWASDELMVDCVAFAKQNDLRMHVHGLETWYQREYGLRRWGKSVVRHLDEIGMLGPWLTLAHMVWVDPEDLALLVERGVGVAHNPTSNLRLRSGIAPVPRLIQAGVRLGIGLDGSALDDDQDYLRELRLAWTLANRPGATAPTIDARTIWAMGTTGGVAITAGPDVKLGILEAGSLADLVLLDGGSGLDDWTLSLASFPNWEAAMARLPELLLRNVSHRNVRHVMIDGRWVVRSGASTGVDESEIMTALRDDLRSHRSTQTSWMAALGPRVREFYAGWRSPGPSL